MKYSNHRELPPIGYVVGLEGDKIRVNLHDGLQGRLASHRDGISSVTQPGDLIGFDSGTILVIARVTEMAFLEPEKAHKASVGTQNINDMPLRQIISYAIGFIEYYDNQYKFTSEDWRLPALGASAVPLSSEFLNVIYSIDKEEEANALEIGVDSRTREVKINVSTNKLLSRHVAVLGSTGYGKSNFNALLTKSITTKFPNSRIVIFDINGEYSQAFHGVPNVLHTVLGEGVPSPPSPPGMLHEEGRCTYKKIPYQALGFSGLIKLLRPSDKTQLPALRNSLHSLDRVFYNQENIQIRDGTGNSFNLYDDCREENQEYLGGWITALRDHNTAIIKTQKWPPFKSLASLVAEFGCLSVDSRNGNKSKRDAFGYSNVLPLVKIIQQLAEDSRFSKVMNLDGGQPISQTGKHWRDVMEAEVDYFFGKEANKINDWNVHIVNLKNLSQDHAPMLLCALLEMFAEILFERGQERAFPTILLLEEAHHYLRDPFSEIDTQVKAYERLAKEGRKFKCSLIVSTQRPSELSSTVLAMCANWFALRLTNERDITALRYAMENGSEHTLKQVSGLPRGDAIAFGSAFNLPLRFTIHEAIPGTKSTDADFVAAWK